MRVVQREREKEKGKKVSTSKSHLAKAKAKADCGPALSRSVHCSRRLKVKCRQRKGGGKREEKRVSRVSELCAFLRGARRTIGGSPEYTSWPPPLSFQRHSSARQRDPTR